MRALSKTLSKIFPGPTPSMYPFGNMSFFLKEKKRLGFGPLVIQNLYKTYGDSILFHFGPMPVVYTRDLELIKYIIQNDLERITKGSSPFLLQDALGNALIWSEGDTWVKKRALMRNAFKKSALEELITPIYHCAQEVSGVWNKAIAEKKSDKIDVAENCTRFTLDVIGRAGFGYNFKAQLEPGKDSSPEDINNVLLTTYEYIISIYYQLLGISNFKKFTKAGRNYTEAVKRLKSLVSEIIEARSSGQSTSVHSKKPDILQFLMNTTDEKYPGQKLTKDEVLNEVLLFFVAGHETTSSMLSWSLYYLSLPENKQVLERLLNELSENGIDNTTDTPPNWSTINNLPYMTQVLKETLRLHPSAPQIARETIYEEKYKEKVIPPKTVFLLHAYSIHRDPRYYMEPVDVWNPEQFSPENASKRNPMAFQGFGTGVRNCIGMQFAMIEARILLSYILPRFIFTSLEKPQTVERIVFRPNRILMNIKSR